VSLAQKVLDQNKNDLAELRLIPSSGGVFEITLEDELLFSKKALSRFPEEDEAECLVQQKLTD